MKTLIVLYLTVTVNGQTTEVTVPNTVYLVQCEDAGVWIDDSLKHLDVVFKDIGQPARIDLVSSQVLCNG